MRGFFTGICFFLFFIAAPLAIVSYLINSFATPDYVKEKLRESDSYEAVAKSMPQMVGLPESDIAEISPEAKKDMEAFLAKEVTADYLQKKTEGAVDSVSDWLSGKTETAPSISLIELKEKMESYAKEKGYLVPEEVSKPLSTPVKIIEPNEGNLRLRDWFQLFQKTPLILGAFCGVLLAIIFLLAQGWKSKLRKLSLAFFVPGFLGLLSVLPVMFLFAFITGAATDQFKGPEWEGLAESIKSLLSSISTDVFKRMLVIYASAIIAAIILFIAAIFVGNKAKEPFKIPTQSKPTEPNS